jgi:hypothetical protein
MSHDDIRARIVEIARAEIGPGGHGSERVTAYWRDVAPVSWTDAQVKQYSGKAHWCGGFTLWCLRQAGLARDTHWKDGLGYLEVKRLPRTRDPKPGDVAYFHAPFQHHALVERLANEALYTIDGNSTEFKGALHNGVWPHKRNLPVTCVYYSIAPFLTGAVTPEPIPPALKRVELKRGDKAEAVGELQTLLNKARTGVTLVVDGDFGPRTENGVRLFQTSRRLTATGVATLTTWAELDALS